MRSESTCRETADVPALPALAEFRRDSCWDVRQDESAKTETTIRIKYSAKRFERKAVEFLQTGIEALSALDLAISSQRYYFIVLNARVWRFYTSVTSNTLRDRTDLCRVFAPFEPVLTI